jgi:hypothetical protein
MFNKHKTSPRKKKNEEGKDIYLQKMVVVCFVLFCTCDIHQIRMLEIMFLVFLESS